MIWILQATRQPCSVHVHHSLKKILNSFYILWPLIASRNRAAQPPPYTPPAYGDIFAAPPPAYEPPRDQYYSWVPYQTFPTAPPGKWTVLGGWEVHTDGSQAHGLLMLYDQSCILFVNPHSCIHFVCSHSLCWNQRVVSNGRRDVLVIVQQINFVTVERVFVENAIMVTRTGFCL